MTSLISHQKLLEFKNKFRQSDLQVVHDPEAGTLKVTDSDRVVCFQAIQKSRRGPWMATFTNSQNVTWNYKGHGDRPKNVSIQRRDLPEV